MIIMSGKKFSYMTAKIKLKYSWNNVFEYGEETYLGDYKGGWDYYCEVYYGN